MATANLSQLRAPTAVAEDGGALLNHLLNRGSFDPDAWHVMQERDTALIRDELMHGVASKAFVYDFSIKGTRVTGVSVVGARELASQYKGIKSRIVATVEKRGALFIFRTFTPLSIETRVLHELADDTDFYECVMEVTDIKTGNSIEVRKKEAKVETKRDGGTFERPHYDVIAESKAFRNGVLSVLPQSVIADFKQRCLTAGNTSNEATIQQRRAAASTYAAKHALALNRQALGELSFAELDGLGSAAAQGVEAFRRSAAALGLMGAGAVDADTGEIQQQPAAQAATPAPAATPAAGPPAAAHTEWQPSQEELEEIQRREVAEAQQEQPQAQARPEPKSRAARRIQPVE